MSVVCQIGGGMIGKIMAHDISKRHELHLADLNENILKNIKKTNPSIIIKHIDANDLNQLEEFIEPADIVLLSVPGYLGYNLLKFIISLKKNIVDISFSPNDPIILDEYAKENNTTVVFDSGLAPGIPNYLLGSLDLSEQITEFNYFVGGLPKKPLPPYNYKAPFSPIDVLEEYTRPARVIENGELIIKPALSEVEEKYYSQSGFLEAFNTDGLRSLLSTMNHIPNMFEKTLRYPGHADLINKEMETGKINPSDTKSLNKLFNHWKLDPYEVEFTILDINIKTKSNNYNFFLYDETDLANNNTSMSRTTGLTASATIDVISNGIFDKKGVFPPEIVGSYPGVFDFIKTHLKRKGIFLKNMNCLNPK